MPTSLNSNRFFVDYLLQAVSHVGPNGEYDVVRRMLQSAKLLNSRGRLQAATLVAAFDPL